MNKRLAALPLGALLALAAGLPPPARAQVEWPALQQTVVVSATRHAMALIDAPAAISVVDGAQIAERGADNVFEALRGELGLSLIGRTISGRRNISLRGMEGRHTLFLVDGKRIGNSDGVIGHSDFQYDWVAVEDIARIEVLRGPMSALYGAEALGGVVNIITRPPGERWALRTLAEGSSADGALGGDGHRAGLSVDGPLAAGWRLAASVAGSRRQAIAAPADARISDIEGRTKQDGALRVFWTPASGHTLSAEHRAGQEDRWAGMKERSGLRRFFQSLTGIERSHSALGWQADWGGAAALRSQLRAYRSQVEMDNQRTQGVAGLRPNGLDDRVLDGQISAEAGPGRLFTAGFEGRDEALRNAGLVAGRAQVRHAALFGQAEIALTADLTLTAGLRHDHHDGFGNAWSPRLYAVWRPAGPWVVKGGFGQGFKAPTLKQISPGYQEDEGPFTYFSNPALRPETNQGWDIGAGWDGTALGVQATLFRNRVKDLIVPRLTGNVAGRGQYLFDNLDQAVFQGLELGSRASLPLGFSAEAKFTWLSALDGAGQRLEKRPRQLITLQAGWQQGPWRAGLRAEHHAGQLIASTVVGQAALPLPDLTRASAHLARQFGSHWEASLGVDNLGQLNLAEASPLFTWAEVPRTWRLALRSHW